jgi:hypothetical protein
MTLLHYYIASYIGGATLSLVLVASGFLSRKRVVAAWAKITSIIACAAAIAWARLGLVLLDYKSYHLTPDTYYRLLGIKGMLGGVAMGIALSILIARPYRKANSATIQT